MVLLPSIKHNYLHFHLQFLALQRMIFPWGFFLDIGGYCFISRVHWNGLLFICRYLVLNRHHNNLQHFPSIRIMWKSQGGNAASLLLSKCTLLLYNPVSTISKSCKWPIELSDVHVYDLKLFWIHGRSTDYSRPLFYNGPQETITLKALLRDQLLALPPISMGIFEPGKNTA